MDRILMVEDDLALGTALEFSLNDEGYAVTRAGSIREVRACLQQESFHIILLDVNLPDGSGYDLCKEIRKHSGTPIIFLTALDEEANVVMGLELRANDYLTKPFGIRELLARIKVQLRTNPVSDARHLLLSGDLTADLAQTRISRKGQPLALTALEYKLLVMFLRNPLQTLKREDILLHISGEEGGYFDENTLSVYIKRLREKIEEDAKNPRYILTKRGLGYQWGVEVTEQ